MKKLLIRTLFFFFLVLFLAACKGRKNRRLAKPEEVHVSTDSIAKAETVSDLLGFTINSWTYFSAKIKVEFTNHDNKTYKPEANIRMYKDSLIWISAGLIGIEGVRMLINRDSLVVYNKMEKTYSIYKNNALQNILPFPLELKQLQNLILGRPLYALELYQFLLKNEEQFSIVYKTEKAEFLHLYKNSSFVINSTDVKEKNSNNYASVQYSAYEVFNTHNFPVNTKIVAGNNEKKIQIQMTYSQIDFESALSFPFTIPSSYEKN